MTALRYNVRSFIFSSLFPSTYLSIYPNLAFFFLGGQRTRATTAKLIYRGILMGYSYMDVFMRHVWFILFLILSRMYSVLFTLIHKMAFALSSKFICHFSSPCFHTTFFVCVSYTRSLLGGFLILVFIFFVDVKIAYGGSNHIC